MFPPHRSFDNEARHPTGPYPRLTELPTAYLSAVPASTPGPRRDSAASASGVRVQIGLDMHPVGHSVARQVVFEQRDIRMINGTSLAGSP